MFVLFFSRPSSPVQYSSNWHSLFFYAHGFISWDIISCVCVCEYCAIVAPYHACIDSSKPSKCLYFSPQFSNYMSAFFLSMIQLHTCGGMHACDSILNAHKKLTSETEYIQTIFRLLALMRLRRRHCSFY